MAEDERFFSRQIYLVAEISEFRSAKYFKCFESFLFISPRSRSVALPFYLRYGWAPWRESDAKRAREKVREQEEKKLRETFAERGECITCQVTGQNERRRRENRGGDFA